MRGHLSRECDQRAVLGGVIGLPRFAARKLRRDQDAYQISSRPTRLHVGNRPDVGKPRTETQLASGF
jgi:hypothetical protein